jgi:tRNA(fMet)-specific endonuclease VapC
VARRLILDTSVLVDAERDGDALERVVEDTDDLAVAALTVAEMKVGVRLAKGRRRAERERFVAEILDAVSVETYDLEVAEAHASLLVHTRREGSPRGSHDLIIAATAVARGRQVVTIDRGGFADLPGVEAVDPVD